MLLPSSTVPAYSSITSQDISPSISSASTFTQTSQALYVKPNPFSCSEIIPKDLQPWATTNGLLCVCQGTTLPLLSTIMSNSTVSNCGYLTLPPGNPKPITTFKSASQATRLISLSTILSLKSSYSATFSTNSINDSSSTLGVVSQGPSTSSGHTYLGTTDKSTKSTGNASSTSVSTPDITSPTLICTAE